MKRLLGTVAALALLSSSARAQLVGDGVTDNKPLWDQLVASACASNSPSRRIQIGRGDFRFASAMAPITCSIFAQGEGPGVSNIIFDYTSDNGYWVKGGADAYGGGSLRDVSLLVASGRTIGFGVHIEAQLETDPNIGSHNPHGWIADNVLVGRAASAPYGSFNYGFYLDGEKNASPPSGVAPGIRLVKIYRSSAGGFNILPALSYYSSGSQFIGFNCTVANPGGQYTIMGVHDGGSTFVSSPCAYISY